MKIMCLKIKRIAVSQQSFQMCGDRLPVLLIDAYIDLCHVPLLGDLRLFCFSAIRSLSITVGYLLIN
jgi:hypothetical protein